jgi:uncharacterized protein YkwD
MDEQPEPRRHFESLRAIARERTRPGMRARLLVPGLILGGLGLIAAASAFLLATDWRDEPPPGEAAEPGSGLVEPGEDALDVGGAFAQMDAHQVYGGVVGLVAARYPTPTPSPTPLPTPTPEPPKPPPSSGGGSPAPAAPPASEPEPQPPPSEPPPSSGCPTASMGSFARGLFDAANRERTSRGLPALAAHGCVVYVAQIRSDDMADRGYFSHTSPDGSTAFSLMDQYGVPYGWAGENLARNNYPDNQTVQVAIENLMNSQGHRDNILSTNYTHMGIGFAVDGAGMKYYTMIFIGPP